MSKLRFRYHRFDFALKVSVQVVAISLKLVLTVQLPWFPECPTCPPNSPLFDNGIRNFGLSKLLPYMENLVRGADSSYWIDVAVTSYKSFFKLATRKVQHANHTSGIYANILV